MQPEPDPVFLQRLRRVPMFAAVEESVLIEIAKQFRQFRFKANNHLFHQNADAPGLHVILSGEVAIHRSLRAGDTLAFAVRRAGEFLGEISLLDGGPATASAIAKTDVLAAILAPKEFERFLAKSPTTTLALLKGVAARLRETTDLLVSAHSQTLCQRLAQLLVREAREDDTVMLDSQRAVGERIGGTREAVNRALKELHRLGALTQGAKRNLYHINRSRLAGLAGQ
jgi:CRP/FNR family cyclic AMP-dependent transcriptional regulator